MSERTAEMRQRAGFVLCATAALTFLAPWGTQALPLPRRAFAWLACGVIWEVVILATSRGIVRPWCRRKGDAAPSLLVRYVLTLLIASLPATLVCSLVTQWPVRDPAWYGGYYLSSLGLGVILLAIRFSLRTARAVSDPALAHMEPGHAALPDIAVVDSVLPGLGNPAQFLRRHAPELAGATLLALGAEDHYLRVHTDRGQALVLLRLRDAIDQLGGASGLQVHRSFWVAVAAVPHASRQGQTWRLVLPTGVSIPVSRTHVPACREQGWL